MSENKINRRGVCKLLLAFGGLTLGGLAAKGQSSTATQPDAPAQHLERIIIRTGGRVLFRRADEIDWIEAYGNYVRLHVEKAAYLLRETISGLEERLDPQKFARIHRSALVQVDRIREVRPAINGQWRVILRDGTQLTMSRRYRRRLPATLAEAL